MTCSLCWMCFAMFCHVWCKQYNGFINAIHTNYNATTSLASGTAANDITSIKLYIHDPAVTDVLFFAMDSDDNSVDLKRMVMSSLIFTT